MRGCKLRVPRQSRGSERPTHGNLARPSGVHSGSVPMMTTASIVRWPSRRHQAWRVEGEKLETRNLRRGWAGSSASLSSPARRIMETHNDRLDRCLLSRALCPYPTICRLWVAHSSVGSRVARRLPGRHSSVAASRCAAGLDFLWGAVPREDRHLGALKVVFCPKAHAGHC